MTKEEDKQLLLVDLCARLPYGVKVKVPHLQDAVIFTLCGIDKDTYIVTKDNGSRFYIPTIIDVFPYLRPMSSMTEEEKEKCNGSIICYNEFEGNSTLFDTEGLDYLNKKMLDYRGLIEKGLALEAPDGMYNNKEEQQ